MKIGVGSRAVIGAIASVLASSCVAHYEGGAEIDGFSVAQTRLSLGELEDAIAADGFPKTTGVLVVKDGAIVYERYFGDGKIGRLNDTRSATKTVVALALGAAIDERLIGSVDDRVLPLFPEFEAAGAPLTAEITFADLLTMTSAFHCDDNNDTPGNEENMYPEEIWKQFVWNLPAAPGWSRSEDGLGPWRYCTAGSFLLGQAIERAAGMPIDEFVRTRIFEPMAIERVAWDKSPSGEIQTGGGLELTLRDLAKLGWLFVDQGRWGERQIVPAAWIHEMTTIRRAAFADMHYGYQIWSRNYATACGGFEAWFMAGNGGNHILAFPSRNLAIAVTREAYNTRGMHQQTNDMVENYILPAALCGAGDR